jgi:hypothetical protein
MPESTAPTSQSSAADTPVAAWIKTGSIVILASVMIVLVLLHIPMVNGSYLFAWEYQRIDWWRLYPAMFLIALPLLVLMFRARSPLERRPVRALILMIVTSIAMQITLFGMQSKPFGLQRLVQVITSKTITSYYTDAQLFAAMPALAPVMDRYAENMALLTLHSREKPPGPILYYVLFIRVVGDGGFSAMVGGIFIGLLSSTTILGTYLLSRQVTNDTRAALFAAGYFSIAPCLVVFFPMFDQLYPSLACGMVGFWIIALRDNRIRASIAFGLVLSVALFFSFTLLVLGAFMVAYAISRFRCERASAARGFVLHSAISLGVVTAIYGLLWLTTGYDPVATFFGAVENQKHMLAGLLVTRPYPTTIPADLQDFLLGSGWISLLLAIWFFVRRRIPDSTLEFGVLGILTILIVALTGLLPGESARVWMMLQPFVLIPIGFELSRWRPMHAAIAMFCLLAITIVIGQNMIFMYGS